MSGYRILTQCTGPWLPIGEASSPEFGRAYLKATGRTGRVVVADLRARNKPQKDLAILTQIHDSASRGSVRAKLT